jgi:hypothetical protein
MYCEPTAIGCMNGTVDRPRPAAETGSLVVDECLPQSGFIIHDERTLLRNGLTDGATLEDEAICAA